MEHKIITAGIVRNCFRVAKSETKFRLADRNSSAANVGRFSFDWSLSGDHVLLRDQWRFLHGGGRGGQVAVVLTKWPNRKYSTQRDESRSAKTFGRLTA